MKDVLERFQYAKLMPVKEKIQNYHYTVNVSMICSSVPSPTSSKWRIFLNSITFCFMFIKINEIYFYSTIYIYFLFSTLIYTSFYR